MPSLRYALASWVEIVLPVTKSAWAICVLVRPSAASSDHGGFVRYLVSSPATDRLGWILDGLNGAADWGSDAADALAPVLTPRLPADFAGYQELAGRGAGARLIVFSGLPGTGKSTLAETAGRQLRVPVFAVDWLLGSLTPFGGYHLDDLLGIGAEMLTTLAFRQLELGQSAILDFPAEDLATRTRWQSLAHAAGAQFRVVVCTCSDRELHRTRLEHRERGIPGWHEGGNWANIERRLAEFPPWTGEVLTIDAVQPLAQNLATVLEYITT
jgi:predicted kinase